MNAQMHKWSLLSLAIAVGLCFAGCDDSKNPLSDPETSKPDAGLAGVWLARDPGGTTYYHIGVVGDKAPKCLLRVLGITHNKSGRITRGGDLVIFPTTLGANTYLNMMGTDDQKVETLTRKGWDSAASGFFIFKYRFDGDALLVWPMDENAKKRAIEDGKIKGLIEKGKGGPDKIEFTDTTENVARFVASAGDSLFSKDVMHLERVK